MCKCTGFTAANAYTVHKWEPNDPNYDKTNGITSKKIMKIKEHSNGCLRCLCPVSCRAYESYFIAEYNRKVAFMFDKPCQCAILCCKRPHVKVTQLKDLDEEGNDINVVGTGNREDTSDSDDDDKPEEQKVEERKRAAGVITH